MDCCVLGKRCPPLMLPEGPSDGPVVAGGPIGQCETLSPLFHDALGPLEHSVPDETIMGLDPLEHSDLDHAGPVGRHVAGGPVGPDETLLGLDPSEHSGPYHAETIMGLDPLEHSGLVVCRWTASAWRWEFRWRHYSGISALEHGR